MKYFLLVAGILAALPSIAQAANTAHGLAGNDIAIYFTNDIHGETEPCG
ncbi:MAG: hypothetical protein OEV73_10240 [Desulfobulbaceae bacterium]|nr:hypothetical protein [Desulfobulbaceae bacterium]